jgi:Spy/CpxP family protein refolding chaperone
MSETTKNVKNRVRGRGRLIFGVLVFAAGALVVAGSLNGWTRHSRGRHYRSHSFTAQTPEEIQERMTKGLQWFLNGLDTTDEQQSQINAILEELPPTLARFQTQRKNLMNRFVEAVEADQVSTEDFAEIRTATLNLTEEATGLTIDATVRVLEVLTPEQRKKLLELWRRHQ